jgi:hypothetical protein
MLLFPKLELLQLLLQRRIRRANWHLEADQGRTAIPEQWGEGIAAVDLFLLGSEGRLS